MVKRLSCLLLLALMLPFPWTAASAQVAPEDKLYRVAAWSFYQQQPTQALETLQLAPLNASRSRLLEAGLYLQLNMPGYAAGILDALLNESESSPTGLPLSLRNIALLQFARYQLELGNKDMALQYLAQVNQTRDGAWLGQQQLLTQLVNWPDIELPPAPQFAMLAQHPEMPYIISNQALILAQREQSEAALNWLQLLQQQLYTPPEQGFWQALFSGQWRLISPQQGFIYPAQEKVALNDYIALLQAKLHVDRKEFAAADAILTDFGSDSVLSDSALELYSHILTEQRHIPTLLAVLQQQVKRQPFSLTAWQAATRIGEQLERAQQMQDALAAFHWAEQYYLQQVRQIEQQAIPLQVNQLQQGVSQWQQLQLSNDNGLHRLQQDILALQQQLAAASERQQRLSRLQDVTRYKLAQQEQLLSSQLPQLQQRQATLQQQYAALAQQIATDEQQPMALSLWQGEAYSQLSRLQRAEQRLIMLQQHNKATTDYAARLQRLRGILQWQYTDSHAERQWQRRQAQQQLIDLLSGLEQQLTTLEQQGNATPRLLQVQQRLGELNSQQQQLNLALLSKQQQLLAELNQQLQQKRTEQLASLTGLIRHNKQAMARVMEQVLLSADVAPSGRTL